MRLSVLTVVSSSLAPHSGAVEAIVRSRYRRCASTAGIAADGQRGELVGHAVARQRALRRQYAGGSAIAPARSGRRSASPGRAQHRLLLRRFRYLGDQTAGGPHAGRIARERLARSVLQRALQRRHARPPTSPAAPAAHHAQVRQVPGRDQRPRRRARRRRVPCSTAARSAPRIRSCAARSPCVRWRCPAIHARRHAAERLQQRRRRSSGA